MYPSKEKCSRESLDKKFNKKWFRVCYSKRQLHQPIYLKHQAKGYSENYEEGGKQGVHTFARPVVSVISEQQTVNMELL